MLIETDGGFISVVGDAVAVGEIWAVVATVGALDWVAGPASGLLPGISEQPARMTAPASPRGTRPHGRRRQSSIMTLYLGSVQ